MDEAFLATLRDRLGPGGVLTGEDVAMRSADPFRDIPVAADAIARPRTTEEVSFVLRHASERSTPVVVQGGRTGISGGVDTRPGELAVSLERMNRIEPACPVRRTVVAEAGVTVEQLQAAAGAAGLFYPVDLGARGTATVGGTIATNAGGNRTLRWGMTRDRVLGLEAVLPDGTIISSMHELIKNNSGYDLKQLFIGAEGTLGIVTRAVFRLVPRPASHEVAFLAVPDYGSVLKLLDAAQRLAALSAFELMYAGFYRAVTAHDPALRPVPDGLPFYVLIESMGYDPEGDRAALEALLMRCHEDGLTGDVVLAQSDQQGRALWAIRESVERVMQVLAPALTFDVSLSVTDIDAYVAAVCTALEAEFPAARLIANGHVGDNNIHLGVTIGPDTLQREMEVDAVVYRALSPFRGSMSAEHGVGTTKNGWLHITRNSEEIALMRRIKQAIDPAGLLNRRVIFEDCAHGVETAQEAGIGSSL